MKTLYKILRTVILVIIGLALLVPALLYVGLELDCVQNPARRRAETELSKLLGAEVHIGQVSCAPYNRVTLRNVSVISASDTLATIRRMGAGIDLYELILRHRVEMGYAEIVGLNLRVSRATPDAPLNIQPIIDALKPKQPDAPKKEFDLAIRTIILRSSRLSYNVMSEPCLTPETRFDKNHITLTDVRADVRIPVLRPDNVMIDLNRLAFNERCGIAFKSITAKAAIADSSLLVIDPTVELSNTRLSFSSLSLPIKGKGSFVDRLRASHYSVALLPGSYITPADLSCFDTRLSALDRQFTTVFDIEGNPDEIHLNKLLVENADLSLELSDANCTDLLSPEGFNGNIRSITLRSTGNYIGNTVRVFANTSDMVMRLLQNTGTIDLLAEAKASKQSAEIDAALTTSAGTIDLIASAAFDRRLMNIDASVSTRDIDCPTLLSGVTTNPNTIGPLTFDAEAKIDFDNKKHPSGDITLSILSAVLNGSELSNITADAHISPDGAINATLNADCSNLQTSCNISYAGTPEKVHELSADIDLSRLSTRLLDARYPHGNISAILHASAKGSNIDDADAEIVLSPISCRLDSVRSATLRNITCSVSGSTVPKQIDISSDIITASITGDYTFAEIGKDAKSIVQLLLPALTNSNTPADKLRQQLAASANRIDVNGQIITTEPLESLIKLPVSVISPVYFEASLDGRENRMEAKVDAPYLLQGKKLIENTAIDALVCVNDSTCPESRLTLRTTYPAKKGKVNLDINANALNDHIDTRISWLAPGKKRFDGNIELSAIFSRPEELQGKPETLLHINGGEAVFNDTVWTIDPANIDITPGVITIDKLMIEGNNQYLSVAGKASALTEDSVHLALKNIDLDYIFETLGINNAMFGGRANGNFYGSALLSSAPRLYTDDLHVAGIKYNHCRMGDAEIRSGWDMENKAVTIKADITGEHGNVSTIDGFIKPLTEELDFKFHADDVPVGFLLPFMEAFTSAVDGHASGDAHLYGTFKLLDMTGDLYANDFKLKLDFTNCWYATTDSVRMRPGRIDIPGVTIRDEYGNTARLDGWVTHTFFKEPRFKFNVSDARKLLMYNIAENPNDRWYGKIFGNGGASISGEPGHIDIDVRAATAPGSTFTFVLSDAQQAYDYTFLTFRDKNASLVDTLAGSAPKRVLEIQKLIEAKNNVALPTSYNMSFGVDVNQNALVTLVMDPVSGDRIKARGNGSLTMTYNSLDEKLGLIGTYSISEGSYNFTLQDIIIKDFTISDQSTIKFNGDPYAAALDVQAVYSLNANLSDLDESFQQDKELSRTNVPIQALLNVTGDIRQPDIRFDLRFPTLTEDTYRKVKSIISTEEMMNRQIIYLLALNRFYTPDYMANATKGNEFVSVASSTISSQLANILGQLSDNWTIAPNFRSDRGDFSDVEFDVALSSRLLNNRLLLNGNLGYRDKSLNNNSFIGDFDLEYLLNRSGSLRLKAYNRYNDRNFYVKSALTTQGVGIMYKRDFDKIFNFLRPRKKPEKKTDDKPEEPTDSTSRD